VKFFLDHDMPEDIALLLHYWGHEVTRLRDILPRTTPDTAVWDYAVAHGLIVITCNRAHFLALANATAVYPGLIN
jgi:predicted nuclease of predicted toxin-antitoxin system